MLPRDTLDAFETPDGHQLTLVRHDRDFYIELDNQELMSTRRTGSELALAELGCAGLETAVRPRILIGGLGLGFTARKALELLPGGATVVVAELFPRVVEWNRTHLSQLYGDLLDDPRLEMVISDVWDQIARGPWHAILLDTDNGPEAFCLERNDRLYGRSGLGRLHEALHPGGTLAVWSADAQPRFVKRLKQSGFEARCQTAREHRNKGHRYTIFLGRKALVDRPGRSTRSPKKRRSRN